MASGGAGAPAPAAGQAVLAIELSQRQGSVALRVAPGGSVATRIVPPASDERDELMPAIEALVAGAGCVPGDIGVVAVSVGPGGFTGLRVAVATAKALALALGARVVAVPSALVVARSVPGVNGVLGVVLAAKGDTAWLHAVGPAHAPHAAHPAARGGLFTAASAPLDGLAALCADEHLPASWARRAAEAGVPVVPAVWAAAACLAEGERLLAADGPCDPQALSPLYPRPPEAVTLWEARNQAAHAGRAG